MRKETIKHDQIGALNVFYGQSSGIMMVEQIAESSIPKKYPKQAIVKSNEASDKIAYWGSNNLFPQEVVADLEKSDLLAPALEKKAGMLYSGGLRYGTLVNENGKQFLKPLQEAEIDDWLEYTNSDLFLEDACSDHFTFYNIFPRLLLNAKRDKIARIECSDAVMTRLGRQDKSDGQIKKAYINGDWASSQDSKDMLELDALGLYNIPQQIAQGNKYDYILPIRQQKNGRIYYQLAPHNGLRVNGWLEVAQSIPKFKKYVMNNQMTLKIIIKVDVDYWAMIHKDGEWEKKTLDEQTAFKKEFFQELLTNAQGNEKAGGFIHLPKIPLMGKNSGEYKEMVTIEPFKNELKGGEYLQDSQEADFHIMRAIGVPPTLMGITPGKGHSAGSGSDQRVARNNFVLDCKKDMNRILLPYKVVSEYNGWDKKYGKGQRLTWWFENYFTATLDSGSEIKPTIEEANGDS